MIRHLIKKPLRAIWNTTAGSRARLKFRIKQTLTSSMSQALEQHAASHTPSTETALAIEDILTELYRLQIKVDQLEQVISQREQSSIAMAG